MTITIEQAFLAHNAKLRDRRRPPSFIVYHTTGGGLARKAARVANPDQDPDAYDRAAVRWYRTSGAKFYPTYLVGVSGRVFQLAPETKATWHAQGPLDEYRGPWRSAATAWWPVAWPGKNSPIDLTGDRDINANSIGIDYLPHPARVTPSDLQLDVIAELARGLSLKHGFPLDRLHHLGHSDVDPINRSSGNKPWDPSWDWTDYMRRLQGPSAPEEGDAGGPGALLRSPTGQAALGLLLFLGVVGLAVAARG